MFLRALIINGFKTFARRTEIRFEGGMTAIVGPNGSGKTNIVDAFKWVLGETQAKDLRGSKMEEVIYSGGQRRPRSSFAEVTLVIDNASGRLPVDYTEVAIGRRVDRGGQSSYFLNGSRVRRRDLLELLQSTGLTVDSYALVNQSDIESIVTCSPGERRVLLEEAASVRGIKARRFEAIGKLSDLADNLLRLEDLRTEIQPRVDLIRAQAEAAREAAVATARLDVLKGSIAWEEWRDARDAGRRAESQLASLRRRLGEAQATAEVAEVAFQQARAELQAAQDRQVARQRSLGALRLRVSEAEHELAMTHERQRNQAALAAAALTEERELEARSVVTTARLDQLEAEAAAAEEQVRTVPDAPAPPPVVDPAALREARAQVERCRRALGDAAAAVTSARARCQFLEESVARLEQLIAAALARLPEAEAGAARTAAESLAAAAASAELHQLNAEKHGLDALRAAPPRGLRRLGDVVTAHPGYEAALSAVLAALIDAWVVSDHSAAAALVDPSTPQSTILYPEPSPAPLAGSLAEHVRCEPGHENVASRLLGQVVVDRPGERAVTLAGVYREPGLLRGGDDPRARLDARRRQIEDRVAELAPVSARARPLAEDARRAEAAVAELRAQVSARLRLEELVAQLETARRAEQAASQCLPDLEKARDSAEAKTAELSRAFDAGQAAEAEHRAEVRRLEAERFRWLERASDLQRQVKALQADLAQTAQDREARARRAEQAIRQQAASEAALPHLEAAVVEASSGLAAAQEEAPGRDAEVAAEAKRLVAIEETRVEARLRVTTLEGQVSLLARESELAQSRMEAVRARMPEGKAPEDVPGGKAREREMRSLERRLHEIGPTNPLAESELAELEERYRTLEHQLGDIAAARGDLEQLIDRLHGEESIRYDAVFGAVSGNFEQYFAELTGGGRATLRHVAGADGAQSGVEMLVQPPRKRLQTVTLLSSGERSLASLALVLALEEVNPSPFTILDEVDAALDDANVERYTKLLRRLGDQRQFLVITHNHGTMAGASALYGVHVDESGCSHLVSARLDEIGANGEVRAASA